MNNEAIKTPTANAKKNNTVEGVFPTNEEDPELTVSLLPSSSLPPSPELVLLAKARVIVVLRTKLSLVVTVSITVLIIVSISPSLLPIKTPLRHNYTTKPSKSTNKYKSNENPFIKPPAPDFLLSQLKILIN